MLNVRRERVEIPTSLTELLSDVSHRMHDIVVKYQCAESDIRWTVTVKTIAASSDWKDIQLKLSLLGRRITNVQV